MSDATAAYATDALLVTAPTEQFSFEMVALLEAVDFEYEHWARIIGLDPDHQVTEDVYALALREWADLATDIGWRTWKSMMDPLVDHWRDLLRERAG